MGKLEPARALRLLQAVVDAMVDAEDRAEPVADARLIRTLSRRLLDTSDPWGRLVLDALDHALDEESSTSHHGVRALAAMLRELDTRPDEP